MTERFSIEFPAKGGREARTGYLYLPGGYHRQPERRYPVLYMFDGHNVFFDSDATFGKSWGLGEYLDRTGAELIVAAVECSHAADNGRLKEYAPFPFSDPGLGKIEGRGRQTMEWLTGEFKAEIDRRCRTLPDREHTFIAGSSMGGLMSLYAVLRYNKIFSRAAALSPSLWTRPERMEALAEKARLKPGTVVYMDYGEKEMGYRPGMREAFSRMVGILLGRGVLLTSRIVPGGQHCEASWERQLPFMTAALLYE